MNCKNCDATLNGKFCSQCGQKTDVTRLRLATFFSELTASVFQVNKGFFFTLIALFIRPGQAIREYLAGKRVKYFKPIAYVFTVSTIYYLIAQWSGSKTFLDDLVTGFTIGANGDTEVKNILKYVSWFASHYAYTVLLLLPVFAFASYLAFIRSGYSYLEHFVLNAYITGQQAIFYFSAAALGVVVGSEDLGATLGAITSLVYLFYAFWQFFNKQKRVKVIFLTVLTYIISMLVFGLLLFVGGYFFGRFFTP